MSIIDEKEHEKKRLQRLMNTSQIRQWRKVDPAVGAVEIQSLRLRLSLKAYWDWS